MKNAKYQAFFILGGNDVDSRINIHISGKLSLDFS